MKWLRITLIVVPVVLILVVLIVLWRLDAIVRSTVQTQATAQLGVPTTLASARVSLLGGSLALGDFAVASPKGFAAPRMLHLGQASLAVTYRQLNDDPIRVRSIRIDRPTLVIEHKDGVLNIKALSDQMPAGDPPSPGTTEPIRVIIDELKIDGAAVVLRPGIPGMPQQIDLKIPDFALNNIGNAQGAQNGAAVREVVLVVLTSLADAAARSEHTPAQLRELLNLDVEAIIRGRLTGVQQEIGKAIEQVIKDPGNVDEARRQLEKGLKDVIGGGSKEKGKRD